MKVAVVGVTGAVGSEILRVLENRNFPVSELVPLASSRSAGKTVSFAGSEVKVQELRVEAFEGVDIALFSAGATRSRTFADAALKSGAWMIDNSSAFRMNPEVPLIVPEINGHLLGEMNSKLVANPNCAAILLTMALEPLRKLAEIRRVVVSTYQSTSGAGAKAMDELLSQTRGLLDGQEPEPEVFQWPIAFNLFSHNSDVEENGYNGEENKVMEETQKILSMPSLPITVTCVRVPVLRAHCEAVNVEFDRPVGEEEIRAAYTGRPGVRLMDDRKGNRFPMPRDTAGQDDVFVGRIRQDVGHPNCIELFLSGDQLLKGAALNAVQIAEAVVNR